MTAGELAVYHGVQGGRVFASALIVKNPRVMRVVVEKSAFILPPLKIIGVFDANLGDRNSPPSFQPLFTHLSNSAIGSVCIDLAPRLIESEVMDLPRRHDVELLYEIALSVGDGLELEPMLHAAVTTMMRLLNCRGAEVWQAMPKAGGLDWQSIYTAPRPLANQAEHQQFLKTIPFPSTEADWRNWDTRSPAEETDGDRVRYLFPMPKFGALLLEKKGAPFEGNLTRAFQLLVNKLAHSAQACVHAQALKAAYAQNTLQSQILDNVSEAVVATDLDERIIYWGRGAERMYGYPATEVLGKPYHRFAGSVQHEHHAAIRQALLKDGYWHGEHQQRRKDGSPFWSDVHISVLRDVDGNPNGFIGIDHDVSQRKAAEAELQRMQRLDALSTVAGGIAHDFNNMLMVVFGNVELAKQNCPRDSECASTLTAALEALETARHLSGQLMTFAKGGTADFETILVPALVEDVTRFNLHGSATQVTFEWAAELAPVRADKGLLSQVIANLVINAAQAMPNGGTLTITGENRDGPPHVEGPARPGVRLAFSDEGCGISAIDCERIFDPYYSTKISGKGLGLAVVHSIVTKHGGAIAVDSQLGVGTTFTLWLAADASASASPASESTMSVHPPATQLDILLMDDDPDIRRMAVRMLERNGHKVAVTKDGDEAVAHYQQAFDAGSPPDVVLLDLTVRGGKGGKQALSEIRQIDDRARIIVCSGYTDDPILADRAEYGIAGKIAKPFLSKDIERELARVMQEN